MIILLSGLFIVGMALAVYALIPFQLGKKKPEEPIPAPILPEPLEQLKIERQNLESELEEQVAGYVKELEKQKTINSDLLNKLKVFEAQIEEYKQEIEKQKAIMQKAVPTQEQVSKKEYDELKKKLEEAEQILRIVHGAGEGEAE